MASDRHGGKSGGNPEVQADGSTIVRFGSRRDFEVPDLVELQTRSYAANAFSSCPAVTAA